jgi:hypothetical protein
MAKRKMSFLPRFLRGAASSDSEAPAPNALRLIVVRSRDASGAD